MKKAVIFDRDGTLIIDKIYLNDASKVEYLPGAFQALQRLRDLGFIFAVATNQSGLAKGIVDIRNMNLIHERMSYDFAKYGVYIAGYYYSPFAVGSLELRRKPNPGMLLNAATDHDIDLKNSWMVGDRMIDVEAGHRAGARSILLKGVETPHGSPFSGPEYFAANLLDAATYIENHCHQKTKTAAGAAVL